MEDKLVTLAIYTFEKAQILKTILENEGIEVYIHNVNLIQPVISAGVRVRIKESDLPKALSIIESTHWLGAETDIEKKAEEKKIILIPVDFSDYSMKACCIGFSYASAIRAEVILLHTFFTPLYATSMPFGDTVSPFQFEDEDLFVYVSNKAKGDMDEFVSTIEKKMNDGELSQAKFSYYLEEGIPEEEIIRYSKEYNPILIVMGTRGKDQKDLDLIGSVTAEVIESSRVPVFAVPEHASFAKIEEIKHIAFVTTFDQKDLVVFDALMKVVRRFGFKVTFVHVEAKEDVWNEVKLAGIREYFKKQYPALKAEYHIIDSDDTLNGLDDFIKSEQVDILALSNHKRNIFARLFNPSIARKMLFHSDTPLLVLKV
ncbi:MAG: universal stress protein [Candidatus Azobacteroides sp.]|nr:universal stress protein [Candidatus Azobacteroides sp.]